MLRRVTKVGIFVLSVILVCGMRYGLLKKIRSEYYYIVYNLTGSEKYFMRLFEDSVRVGMDKDEVENILGPPKVKSKRRKEYIAILGRFKRDILGRRIEKKIADCLWGYGYVEGEELCIFFIIRAN